MKKFHFRLESVLGHREQVEREREAALTRMHRGLSEQKQRLVEALTRVESAVEELRGHEQGPRIDAGESCRHRLHLDSLRIRAAENLNRLQEMERELARRRDEAVQARREREVLQTLKARRHARYLREIERNERIELDDLANRREAVRRTQGQE